MPRKDSIEGLLGSPIPEMPVKQQKKGLLSWAWTTFVRLTVYYSIYLAIFSCPLNQQWPKHEGTKTDCYSSTLCHAIHGVYDAAAPVVGPVISPYYTKYAQSYVDYSLEKAQPAVAKLSEGCAVVIPKLQHFGDSVVEKAQPYTEQVNAKLGPYVDVVKHHNHKYVAPVTERVQQAYGKAYHEVYVPLSEKAAPHLAHTEDYVSTTAVPVLKHYLSTGYTVFKIHFSEILQWLEIHVAGPAVSTYKDNVEPHVSKIYNRVIENRTSKSTETIAVTAPVGSASPLRTDEITATLIQESGSIEEKVYSIQPVGTPEVNLEGTPYGEEKVVSIQPVGEPEVNLDGYPVEEEKVVSIQPVGEPEVELEGYPVEEEKVVSIQPVGEPEVNLEGYPAEEEKVVSIQPVGEPVVHENGYSTAKHSPTPTPAAEDKTSRMQNELKYWQGMIEHTMSEAFSSFLDDCEDRKQLIAKDARPRITELLQHLQKVQVTSLKELSLLVSRIPTGLEEEGSEEAAEKDPSITPDTIQTEFGVHAEALRDGALAVRQYCTEIAQRAVDETEQLRLSTLEVLDEFAEVSIGEIGRNLVRINSKYGAKSMPDWYDWRDFKLLKDKIIDGRQELVDHDVNMADINQLLKEAQETANILVSESAKVLSGLKGKSSYIFQQQLVNRNKKLEESGSVVDEEFPEDAIIYEELEEEPEQDTAHTPEETKLEDGSFGGDSDFNEDEDGVEHITTTSTLVRYETIQAEESQTSTEPESEPEPLTESVISHSEL